MQIKLLNQHKALGAKIIDFFGWEMPLSYDSIIKEHLSVRDDVGVFDVSHMGNFILEGPDSYAAINYLISNDLGKIKEGSAIYSPLLYANGTFVDDIIVYYQAPERFLLIVNASNIDKDFAWINKNLSEKKFNAQLKNISNDYSLLAIQGKESKKYIAELLGGYDDFTPFTFKSLEYEGEEIIVANTGYTGEVGVEVLVPNGVVEKFFKIMVQDLKIKPCGLGARDTLRTEKGYSLYGNEINDKYNALEAGLGWTVSFNKDFIGKEALENYKSNTSLAKKKISGFILEEKALAKTGHVVYSMEEEAIGLVTSGCFSPSLKKNIGLCYVPKAYKNEKILINLRNKFFTAVLHKRTFI